MQTADAPASQWYSPVPANVNASTQKSSTLPPSEQLPHTGSLSELNQWWQSLGDPLLVELISSAQAVSPTITAAASRLQLARSVGVAAGAALLPNAGLAASSIRTMNPLSVPVLGTVSQVGLQANWELDLFGGNRAARDAALARVDGSTAMCHEARVSVAAEVASTYLNLRTCEQLLAVAKEDLASRSETSRLTGLTADAGFTAPANAALARASAAQSQSNLSLQRTQCEINIKVLVALTALQEPVLRQKLAVAGEYIDKFDIKSIANSKNIQSPALPLVPSVPAQLLLQRPDRTRGHPEAGDRGAELVEPRAAHRRPRRRLRHPRRQRRWQYLVDWSTEFDSASV